ncbi:MAG: tail fiber domain-containing protein [bacterium]|nr:tail fiber domain-containing protein [bacterium]
MTGPNGLSWSPKVAYGQLVLTVSGPDGTVISKTFNAGVTPGFDLGSDGLPVLDGSYTYQLVVIPNVLNKGGNPQTGDRGTSGANLNGFSKGLTQTGYFSVQGGSIVNGNLQEGPGLSGVSQRPDGAKDQVINDDLIVTFSACIGNDCVNGESFGFDTLRLKENNLRIKFQDTSSSSSFPTNDWQITANDSSNGGANKFSIDDIDGGRTPFTIQAGAPSNSMYVDSGGDLGLGTSTPVVDLHVVSGNTPTLRLEQNGSSGFTPQTWDVAGNEANFFIRDVTNSSKLPFKIKPGAPTGSIYVKADGKIGFGTESIDASATMHVLTASGTNAQLRLERTGASTAVYTAGNSGVNIGAQSNHPLKLVANAIAHFTMDASGNITLTGGGSYSASTGDWTNTSTRTAKENIKELSAEDAIEAFTDLKPVTYNYLKHDENKVGFIAEDVPELVATKSRKSIGAMDVIAVLTKVVQEQQKTIEKLEKRLEKVEDKK